MKEFKELAVLICDGKLFQSLPEQETNARSPNTVFDRDSYENKQTWNEIAKNTKADSCLLYFLVPHKGHKKSLEIV